MHLFRSIRLFLTQSDLSVDERPFSTEAQIGLPFTVEKKLFRLSSPTGGSSRKTLLFRPGMPVEKLGRKSLHLFLFNPSPSLIQPQNTHAHAHTLIPDITQQYHTAAPTLAWLSLLLHLAASQSAALLAPLASSVYHTTAAARVIDVILPTTATPAVAVAALG